MKGTWRLLFLVALLLPEAPLDPFQGALAPGLAHPLGTDELGRDALLRLALAGGRSLGFATAAAQLGVLAGLLLAVGKDRWGEARRALRALPPVLFLLPLAGAAGGLGWLPLGVLIAALLGLQLEVPLRARLDPLLQGPAWASTGLLGASPWQRWRSWAPCLFGEAESLLASAWIAALWGEVTLSALGLGPGPAHDSLGRLLGEEIPRLGTDPTPLGWGALAVALGLAWCSSPRESP
jgi:peptide/nickel transport system permease protein